MSKWAYLQALPYLRHREVSEMVQPDAACEPYRQLESFSITASIRLVGLVGHLTLRTTSEQPYGQDLTLWSVLGPREGSRVVARHTQARTITSSSIANLIPLLVRANRRNATAMVAIASSTVKSPICSALVGTLE